MKQNRFLLHLPVLWELKMGLMAKIVLVFWLLGGLGGFVAFERFEPPFLPLQGSYPIILREATMIGLLLGGIGLVLLAYWGWAHFRNSIEQAHGFIKPAHSRLRVGGYVLFGFLMAFPLFIPYFTAKNCLHTLLLTVHEEQMEKIASRLAEYPRQNPREVWKYSLDASERKTSVGCTEWIDKAQVDKFALDESVAPLVWGSAMLVLVWAVFLQLFKQLPSKVLWRILLNMPILLLVNVAVFGLMLLIPPESSPVLPLMGMFIIFSIGMKAQTTIPAWQVAAHVFWWLWVPGMAAFNILHLVTDNFLIYISASIIFNIFAYIYWGAPQMSRIYLSLRALPAK